MQQPGQGGRSHDPSSSSDINSAAAASHNSIGLGASSISSNSRGNSQIPAGHNHHWSQQHPPPQQSTNDYPNHYPPAAAPPPFVSPATPPLPPIAWTAPNHSLEQEHEQQHHGRKTPRHSNESSSGGGGCSQATATEQEEIDLAFVMPHGKRNRNNAYIAPRHIPHTFTSQMGSLAVPHPRNNHHPQSQSQQSQYASMSSSSAQHHPPVVDRTDNARQNMIGFRRQLSGSKIEAFLHSSNDDSMDVEPDSSASSRPRSMSL